MADVPTTLSLVTLATEYRGDVIRNINRKCETLRMLPVVAGEGKNIAWAPEGDGSLFEAYSEGADAANFGRDVQDSAILTWALYRSNFRVTSLAMDAAATSSTPEGNRQLWARNLVNSAAKLASGLNATMYSGAGTTGLITGLGVAIQDGNTYAGINRATSGNEYWRSTVIDPGAPTEVTFELMRDDLRQIYETSGETPQIAASTPAIFNKVGNLFDATRRRIETIRGGNGGEIKLEFGYQALEVDGTVFFRDKDATADTIYYLNVDHVRVEYLPSASQNMLVEAAGGNVHADDGFGAVPLGMKFEMLAKTGPAEKAEILWNGNLVVDRPNTCGKRVNVVSTL